MKVTSKVVQRIYEALSDAWRHSGLPGRIDGFYVNCDPYASPNHFTMFVSSDRNRTVLAIEIHEELLDDWSGPAVDYMLKFLYQQCLHAVNEAVK